MDKFSQVPLISGFFLLFLIFSPLAVVAQEYQFEVQLLKDSDLSCGIKINSNEVESVNVQPMLNDKSVAVSEVYAHFPDHGLESPIPVLIEKVHLDGGTKHRELLGNAVRESAYRGCDLLIVLDIAIEEKIMYRPPLLDLKLPVSYVLVLFGSKIKDSADSEVE